MANVSLKHIIGSKKELYKVVAALISQLNTTVWIEDETGKLLYGEKTDTPHSSYPVILDEEIVGYVKGDESGKIIASLLTQLIFKEAEKKNLGTEVLNLYQEINVIFNFTETLTQTIEPDIIARLTLEQAIHSVNSQSGVIVLWDEEAKELQIPAVSGQSLFNENKISKNAILLLKIGLSGQSEIMTDISILKEKGIIDESVQSIIYAAMKVKHRIMGAIILAGNSVDQFSAGHLKLLVTLALQSSAAIESALLYEKNIREVREREEAVLILHEATKKFVPNEFIRSLGRDVLTDVKLGDLAEKRVTVLFTDIRDFTSLSEKMTPEENFRFVSSFNARLGPIIRSHNGFINQYLGDSIMAIFPANANDALTAAIDMQRAVQILNNERAESGLTPIKAGIGMHTGSLIMGITGDEHRLDACTISDTVNTASRIESLTKYYKSPLLLSQETFLEINSPQDFHIRHLGAVRLKGKNKLLNIIECFDGSYEEDYDNKMKTLSVFTEAMNYYNDQQFEKAINLFQQVIDKDSKDLTAHHFMFNANKYFRDGVAENWTGAEEMMSK
ncbi:MAG: adenylate/guanylate cyclase domain-containing protein [Chitinophagaceae bacterium]